MNNQKYKTKDFKKKKLKKRIVKASIFLVAIAIIIAILSYLSKLESFLIKEIQISETVHVNNEEIKNEIESLISGSYFFLFPKRNFLIYPRDEIYQNIYDNSVAISEVKINIESGNKLNIEIKEHDPVAKWCVEHEDVTSDVADSKDCFLINRDGLVYGLYNPFAELENPLIFEVRGNISIDSNSEDGEVAINIATNIDVDSKLQNTDLKEVESERVENWPIGVNYIEAELFKNIQIFVGLINDNLNIKTIYIKTEDFESFQIRSTTGPFIWISKFDNPERIFSNLKTVMENEEINKAQFKNLEYVDLRFDNRIYYKIK